MIARTALFCILGFAALGAFVSMPAGADTAPAAPAHDGVHDFDFFFGQWTGAQHKLKHRLANSNEWEDFTSFSDVHPLLGGRANMDQIVFQSKEGGAGATFRVYDPQKQQWSIYWIGSTEAEMDVPVVGKFVDGRGEFYAEDTWEGKPVRVRFLWTHDALTHARWEQAFSTDGGKTWETNWVANFTRTAF